MAIFKTLCLVVLSVFGTARGQSAQEAACTGAGGNLGSISNGRCNTENNNFSCAYDGGDCCSDSCTGACDCQDPNIAPLPAYTPLGCYTDGASQRIMKKETSASNMSTEKCARDCKGNFYFGTQNRDECWCGGKNTNLDTHGKSKSCFFTCAGNSQQFCGGHYAMSVYKYTD